MNQMKQPERKFVISENLASAVLQYLAKKPYEEVYPLIAGLQQLMPYVENVEQIKEKTVE